MADAVRHDLPAPSFPLMTVDEFWAQPARSGGVTFELVNGRLRPQDAAGVSHGSIQGNIEWLINQHLKGVGARRCRLVVAPGVPPLLNANWNHRIPELAVTCAPPSPISATSKTLF